MLKPISYLPVNLAMGCYKVPSGAKIVGSHAVCDTKNGNSGVLIQFAATGMYQLFSAGVVKSVDPQDVRVMLLTV